MRNNCFLLLLLVPLFFTTTYSQKLTIATYNMRYANAGDSANGNGWGQRLPVIASLIKFNGWDIFGTQECKYNQIKGLTDSLPDYTCIGVGRDDGKEEGEFSAIFYKKKAFRLLQSHTFWLSADTTKPNKGWDAMFPRVCTWGKFQEIITGFTFYVFNLHMDHIGVVARRESAKLVLQKIKAMAGNTPTIFTGDFNVDQNNESYTLINTSGLLKDAYELAPVKLATNGTFNNFSPVEKTDRRIDHIFLTKEFAVKRYAVLTNTYWSDSVASDTLYANRADLKAVPRLPSDHYPVMAEVEYRTANKKK